MKKVPHCHVETTLKLIGGKWKLIILWHLAQSPLRFSELQKQIPDVSQKMLTSSLRELEQDALVSRTVHAQVPPRVEYALTPQGVSLGKVLRELDAWGEQHLSTPVNEG